MMTKNNKRTRKLGTQKLVVRLILLVSTLVLMGIGTAKLVSINAKILGSQWRMYSYYTKIDKYEKERNHNNNLATSYHGPYAKIAQDYDDEVESLLAERKAYVNDSTGVVRWSIKDGFSILTVLIGLGGFATLFSLWWLFFERIKSIVDFEVKLFTSSYYLFFSILYYICCRALGYNVDQKKCNHHRRKKVVPSNKRKIG